MTDAQADSLIDRPSGTTPTYRLSDKGNMTATFGLTTLTVYPRRGLWWWCRHRRARFGKEGETVFSPTGFDREADAWEDAYRAAGWPVPK